MDGIIIINKPLKLTSQQVVSKVKKELNVKKAGHTGTLDPMATGVLPILLGKATKLSDYLIQHDKKYVATIFLGQKKDTADQEGETIEEKKVPILNEEEIKRVLNLFKGKSKQIPPMYSAIKINGKKLYEYAREGMNVERTARDIEIYNIELLEYKNNLIKFSVECSKGTYIRVLCEDIAQKLNTVGYMYALERTSVNDFKIDDAIDLDKISNNIDKVISIEKFFENKKEIILNQKKLKLFINGMSLTYNLKDDFYRIYDENRTFIGMGIIKNESLKRDIIILNIV